MNQGTKSHLQKDDIRITDDMSLLFNKNICENLLGILSLRFYMMPPEKLKVVMSKINSGDGSLVPVHSSVKTQREFCDVLSNKHYMEK